MEIKKHNSAADKLRSQSGASLLIAMVIFLVACFVSTVIISAAFTSAKRTYDDKGEKESYLAINSAGRFISESIKNSSVERISESVDSGEPVLSYKGKGKLGAVLAPMVEEVDKLQDSSSKTFGLDISVSQDLVSGCAVELTMHVGDDDESEEYYRINGTIKSEDVSNMHKIYFTAWIPTSSSDTEETSTTSGSVITVKRKLKWSKVELTTHDGTTEG
ncbi:MAG: hypothetical protein K6F00_11960 [Lachnospiraceae bacterium]|nr:hypothetical protein [Lachnospiraceae bacterium]